MNSLLGMKLGEGGYAEIYEWEDASKIIKLTKSNTGMDVLATEFGNSQAVWEKGLSVPRPCELAKAAGVYQSGVVIKDGLIYRQRNYDCFERF